MDQDFNTWEEVAEWLSEEDDYNQVSVHVWTFSLTYMSCNNYDDEYGPCCDNQYNCIEETITDIKHYSNNNIAEVEKV